MLSLASSQIISKLYHFVDAEFQHLYGVDSSIRGNLFSIAAGLVLDRKQKEYNNLKVEERLYAIDYYGVRSINKLYFPSKIEYMMDRRTVSNTYYHLSKVSVKELSAMTGPLKYMVELAPIQEIDQLLVKAKNGDARLSVYTGSFIEHYLLHNLNSSWVQPSPLREEPIQGEVWESLPRKVWIFWSQGI